MWSRILSQWSADPPEVIVVGGGSHARALVSVLRASMVRPEDLLTWDIPEGAAVPRVIEYLHTIFLAPGPALAAGDVVRLVEGVRRTVERISSLGPDHELRWILCPLHKLSPSFVESLAGAWCADVEDLPATGWGIWKDPGSLAELPELMASVVRCDLVQLRNRRHADGRRQALGRLVEAVRTGDAAEVAAGAGEVAAAFAGREYDLDLFCRPPSHSNGNQLRRLLRALVTPGVTPEECREAAELIPSLLA